MAKVRYVAQVYADSSKEMLVHDVTALRPASIRIILSTAAVLALRLFSYNVTQAYLQATDLLTRLIFLRPKAEDRSLFGLADDELLQIINPLYGLCDSGDYCNITINSHMIKVLKIERAKSAVSLYFRFSDGKLRGINENYFDDNMNAGDKTLQGESELTMTKFESKPRIYDSFIFLVHK